VAVAVIGDDECGGGAVGYQRIEKHERLERGGTVGHVGFDGEIALSGQAQSDAHGVGPLIGHPEIGLESQRLARSVQVAEARRAAGLARMRRKPVLSARLVEHIERTGLRVDGHAQRRILQRLRRGLPGAECGGEKREEKRARRYGGTRPAQVAHVSVPHPLLFILFGCPLVVRQGLDHAHKPIENSFPVS